MDTKNSTNDFANFTRFVHTCNGEGEWEGAGAACVRSNSVKLRGNAWNGSENNVYVPTYIRVYVRVRMYGS